MDFAQLNGAEPTSGPRWLRAEIQMGPLPLADALVRGGQAQDDRLRRPCRAGARGVPGARPHRLPGPARPALQRGSDRAVARQMGRARTSPATGSTASISTTRRPRSWSARTRSRSGTPAPEAGSARARTAATAAWPRSASSPRAIWRRRRPALGRAAAQAGGLGSDLGRASASPDHWPTDRRDVGRASVPAPQVPSKAHGGASASAFNANDAPTTPKTSGTGKRLGSAAMPDADAARRAV